MPESTSAIPARPIPVSLEALPIADLERMARAADEIAECERVLERGGLNIVGEVLRGQGTFYELDHYPSGDVFDDRTHAQYYYHAHRGVSGEHGHFHTFMRRAGIAPTASPAPYLSTACWPDADDALAHLVAISMDARGRAVGLFTTNRWVTGETWYRSDDVVEMVRGFEIDHAYPSWPANRWLGAMMRLFEPEIVALLRHRDVVVSTWAARDPDRDVLEDRALEITGSMLVSVETKTRRVRSALEAALRGDAADESATDAVTD
ncbi:MAG: hypothetical protein H6983_12485 [Ectothiorhodospiraceae bacterium]|nr:hypothetical protein [Chromatiales bacterium]MCP5154979.1 hypothetical protein [Ectothiorhodospiraceae bacterium]